MRISVARLLALASTVAVLLVASVPSASAQSAGGWTGGPGAILDNTYVGFVDQPANGSSVPGSASFTVSGWIVDKVAQGWAGVDDVQVWLGTMDGGGKLLGKAAIGQARPDVAAALGNPYVVNSGFSASIAGSSVPSGPQTLNVYAHTGGKGWWYTGVSVTGGGTGAAASAPSSSAPASSGPAASTAGTAPSVTINNPTEAQNVPTNSDYTVSGSVSDPTNIDRVEVWINGERNAPSARLLGTVTPTSDGSWNVTFAPTHFASTHSNLYVYAHNKATGLETEAVRGFNIVDKK